MDAVPGPAQLRPITISADGRRLAGTLLDLSRKGYGWSAEARLNDQYVLELAGRQVEPDMLPLVRLEVDGGSQRPHV